MDRFYYSWPFCHSNSEIALMEWNKKIEPGLRAVVLGMGISGRAMVEFLLSKKALVAVVDNRDFTDLSSEERTYLTQNRVSFMTPAEGRGAILHADFIAISPGVPKDLPILSEVRERDIPILGELALAAPYLTETVIAVTGTNGKTTVTALIAELLRASGKKVFVGGNIGTPVLDYLMRSERVGFLVLELSSFQLESAGTFRPDIGILLNITPDHLDRHKTMGAYIAAKMRLFRHQKVGDVAIISGEDSFCQQVKSLPGDREVLCFGGVGSGCATVVEGTEITINHAGVTVAVSITGTALESHTGLLNASAASLAAFLSGCDDDAIQQGLESFVPEKHRLQYIKTSEGVDYYNDSKATNTGAVCSALASFSGNVILIAGGRDKGEEYAVLKEPVREKVKKLILIGEAARNIADVMENIVDIEFAGTMDDAVVMAARCASSGDTVLLAPACASFDMFGDYGQRGDVFTAAVCGLQDRKELGAIS